MLNQKKKERTAHSISDSSEHETESLHSYRDESPAPESPLGKQDKKKKYRAGIPLFSMEDFSDLTSAVPKIEFPSDLKVRHPLFGIDFEERVGLAASRKKKKSKLKAFEDLAAVKQETFSSSEGEATPKKKSRKELNDVEMVDISRRIKIEAYSPNCKDSDARVKKKSRKSSL